MDRPELERVLKDGILVPGPDGPCDADAKARMRQHYLAYHDRIVAYGRARRDALITARCTRWRKADRPTQA